MTDYVKLSDDEKVIGNDQVGWNLELEGVCRGVIFHPRRFFYPGGYSGLHPQVNNELVPFDGRGQLGALMAKTSYETSQVVKMWCHYDYYLESGDFLEKPTKVKGLWLVVDNLMLGDLKTW